MNYKKNNELLSKHFVSGTRWSNLFYIVILILLLSAFVGFYAYSYYNDAVFKKDFSMRNNDNDLVDKAICIIAWIMIIGAFLGTLYLFFYAIPNFFRQKIKMRGLLLKIGEGCLMMFYNKKEDEFTRIYVGKNFKITKG